MRTCLLLCLSFLIVVSCTNPPADTRAADEKLRQRADSLAHAVILVDTHVDLPYRLKVSHFRLEREYIGIPVSTPEGDFDYERAKRGGLDAPFMSIYIPSSYQQQPDFGKGLADSLINMISGITEAHPDKFMPARSPSDLEDAFRLRRVALPLGMENGCPIGKDLSNVKYFFDRGIRYITLTHSKHNQICDSSYDTTKVNFSNGLTPFGEQVVKEMNRLGMMVDISHVSDSAFYDVMRVTRAPAIASHSSCRYYTPGFHRNMSDDMIKALAANGGVIQVNFGAYFLDSAAQKNEPLRDSLEKKLKASGLTSRDSAAGPIIDQFVKDHAELFSDVERVADHIDHVVALTSVDHVGLGSDFDGVGDSLPLGLKDVSQYPNLIYVLLKRGYSDEDIRKICGGNLIRVWNKVIAVAQSQP